MILTSEEFKIINNPFFQRLRFVSQLGFVPYVFPCATHTRFSHSLGATCLAGRVFDRILSNNRPLLTHYYSEDQLNYFRRILRFAALLHDIGHPPFSHAAEILLPKFSKLETPDFLSERKDRQATHEDFSHAIIYHLAKEGGLLTLDEAYDILSILNKKLSPSEKMRSIKPDGEPLIRPLLSQLINGEIDVDRMDYLLRDSYFTGVPYGHFDLDRLVRSFSCYPEEKLGRLLLTIDADAIPTYENFLLARTHMFYQIYFHKSLAIYTYYLQQALLEKEITIPVDGAITSYLEMTEDRFMEEFRKAKDKFWSNKLYHRIPAKNLIRATDGEPKKLERLWEIHEKLSQKGIQGMVTHSSNQYTSQTKKKKIEKNTILVLEEEFGKTNIYPLAGKSKLLKKSKRKIEITQLYVHRTDFDQAIKIVQKMSL